MLVQIVVAVVDHVFQHADDLIGNTIDADALANGILAGKELLLDVGADECDTSMREVVGLAKCTTLG